MLAEPYSSPSRIFLSPSVYRKLAHYWISSILLSRYGRLKLQSSGCVLRCARCPSHSDGMIDPSLPPRLSRRRITAKRRTIIKVRWYDSTVCYGIFTVFCSVNRKIKSYRSHEWEWFRIRATGTLGESTN